MFCTNCGKQVEKGVKFCPDCGKSPSENNASATQSSTINRTITLQKQFWITLIGSVGIVLFSLMNWFRLGWEFMDFGAVRGFSLFSFLGQLNEIRWLFDSELDGLIFGVVSLLMLLLTSFLFFVISLIKHKEESEFAFGGFLLAGIVSLAVILVNFLAPGYYNTLFNLTAFPYLTLVIAVAASICLKTSQNIVSATIQTQSMDT